MSLVQYDSSGPEDSDDDTKETKEEESSLKNLFAKLPRPKSTIDEGNEFESKKEEERKRKQPIKIFIPSIDEFPEEDMSSKKVKMPKMSSGLVDILPAPRNSFLGQKNTKLIPHVLTKKEEKTPTTAPETQSACSTNVELVSYDDKDSDNEESDNRSDFFSLESNNNTPSDDITNSNELTNIANEETDIGGITPNPEDPSNKYDAPLNFQSGWAPIYTKPVINPSQQIKQEIYTAPENYQHVEENNQEHSVIDGIDIKDERFLRLQGKKERGKEDIHIIDISADQQFPGNAMNLIKGLTEEQLYYPSRKKHEMPTPQQRRKHQITYLAFQAKERELELKNQWSKNRMTRRQTQAKYGF